MAKKVEKIVPDKKTILNMVSEYQELKKKEKVIAERKKLLADNIKAYAQENGTKDSNGNVYVETDSYIFGSQCRKSVSLDEAKAMKLFNLKGFDECIELKPVINEKAVELRLAQGDITPEEIESVSKTKTTMAIDVREKEEVVEIQQTKATIAAQKKPKLKLRKPTNINDGDNYSK